MRRLLPPVVFLALVLPASAVAQLADPITTVLHTNTSSLQTSNKHLVRRAVKSAAPMEVLPAPSPNPNNLVSTDKVGYCVWKDLQSTSQQDIVFARTNDSGRTWKVQTIHTAELGQQINHFEIVAVGHTVWVGFHGNPSGTSTRKTNNPAPGEFNMFYLLSLDQGQSWNTGTSESSPKIPTPVDAALVNLGTAKTADANGNNTFGDAERIAMAGTMVRGLPRCYFAYEFGNTLEEPIITAIQVAGTLVSVIVPETLLTQPGTTPNASRSPAPPDTDNIFVAADGLTVLVVYRDNRGTPANNAVFGNWSLDGGKTWLKNDVMIGTNTSTSWSRSKHDGMVGVAVDGTNFYVTWGDRFISQLDNNQALQMAWSNDSGKTWKEKPLTTFGRRMGNIRAHGIVADNGRVVAMAETDELARKLGVVITDIGLVNGLEVYVSQDAGATFKNTFVHSPQSKTNITDVDYPMIAMRGDIIHIAFAESWYNQTVFDSVNSAWFPSEEDVSIVTSTDGGKTFSKPILVTKIGSRITGKSTTRPTVTFPPDVDVPRLAIMGNGEAVIGFRSNHVPVVKPTLVNRPFASVVCPLLYGDTNDISAATGGSQNLSLCAGTKHKGQAYLVAGSVTGTTPGVTLGSVHIPLNADLFTNITIAFANTPTFVRTRGLLDANGRGMSTIVVPNGVTSAVGVTMHFAYLVADSNNNLVLASNPARLSIKK